MTETPKLEQHLRTIKRRLAVIEIHLERAHKRDRLLAQTVQFLLEKLTVDGPASATSSQPEQSRLTREAQENQKIGAWLIKQFTWDKIFQRMKKEGFPDATQWTGLPAETPAERQTRQREWTARWMLTKKSRATILAEVNASNPSNH